MHGRNRRLLGTVVALLAAIVLSSCQTDWVTWGFGLERQGYNPWERTVGPANVSQLHHQWSVNLGAYINASPVVATNININGSPTDVIYVGTEHGDFSAISTTGRVLWTHNLGNRSSNCPNTPDQLYGVSASAVINRGANRVYVVGGDGNVYALDPATGATLPGWPVSITADPSHEFVYSAPTQSGTNLYVALSSRCDIPPYQGRLVRINTETRATNAFYVGGNAPRPNGGGIWGWGGPSVDPYSGDPFVATGNMFTTPENLFYGDHIVRLNSNLAVVAAHSPGVGIEDDDFGSTPVLFQRPGCPPQLVTEQKNGSVYLYDQGSIASGYRQKVSGLTDGELIGVPAYSPATQMVYVVNPQAKGSYVKGLLAFRVDASCTLQLAWQYASPIIGLGSTPTIANGVVYYSDGVHPTIHAINASTGAPLWASGPELTKPVLAAPIMVNGQLLAGSYDGQLHAWGLPK